MSSGNYILIDSLEKWDLEKILNDFIKLYSNEKFVEGIKFSQKKDGTNSFLISFTNQPDFEGFSFLVNYLKYPTGFKELDTNPVGFLKGEFLGNKFKLSTGDWNMIYVSTNDKDYDNVSITTSSNEAFLFDFGGGIKKQNVIEKEFYHNMERLSDFNQAITISTNRQSGPIEKTKSFPWEKIKDLAAGITCLFLSAFIFINDGISDFKPIFGSVFLGVAGIFMIWKELRNKK